MSSDVRELLLGVSPPIPAPPGGLARAQGRARVMRRRATVLRAMAVPVAVLVTLAAVTAMRESSRVRLVPADQPGGDPARTRPSPGGGAPGEDAGDGASPGSKGAARAPRPGVGSPTESGRPEALVPVGAAARTGTLLYRNRNQLWVKPLSGGEPRRVMETQQSIFGWASDGRHVLFAKANSADDDTGVEIALLDTETGALRPVLRHRGFHIYSAAMSPDGTKIVYTASESRGFLEPPPPPSTERQPGERLFVADADGTDIRPLNVEGGTPTWAPDNRRILFRCSRDDAWVCTVRDDGSDLRGIGRIVGPHSWSPDGQWIAGYGADGLSIYRPDGTGGRSLGVESYMDVPQWTPDSKRLVYKRTSNKSGPAGCQHPPCDLPPGIFAVAIDGSRNEIRLTTDDGDEYPLVSLR